MSSVHDRESLQQARIRSFNEWIENANESMGLHPSTERFRCECGDDECAHTVDLTRAEYEAERSSATRFVTASNHESPSDHVVAERQGYTVVEKLVGRRSRHARRTYAR